MSYLTEAELKARVGGEEPYRLLTDDNGDGIADDEVKQTLLEENDAELDGYFRSAGLAIPLSATTFSGSKRYALDIVNYRLKTRGSRRASEDDRKLYEDAMAYFKMVAGGKIHLTTVDLVSDFVLQGEKVIFNASNMGGF